MPEEVELICMCPHITTYVSACLWYLIAAIYVQADPEYDEVKSLVHECFYMLWVTGAFLPEFAPEWAGSYLIALQKPG